MKYDLESLQRQKFLLPFTGFAEQEMLSLQPCPSHAPLLLVQRFSLQYLLQWHVIKKKKRLKILANYFVNQGFLFSTLLTRQIKARICGAQKTSAQQKWNTKPKAPLCGLFPPSCAVPAFGRSGAAAPCSTPAWGRCQEAALCCPARLPAVVFSAW